MRRPFVVLLVFVCLSVLACAQASPAAEPVKLNFLEVMTSPARTAVLREVIEKFQATHPNITINLISPPYEQADNKLTLMMNAREPLDIVEVRNQTVMQYVNNGLLESLEPRLKTWPDAKTLLPVTLEAARAVKNTAYMLPEYFYIKALFLRTDILKKLGVETPPASMQQLYDLAKKITKPASNQYGFAFRGKGNAYRHSDLMILSDLPNLDPNRAYHTTGGKTVFEDPQFVKSLKAYIDLFKTAVPPDGINWGFNEQVNAFVSGTTPILIQDPDTVPLVEQQLGKDKYTVVPLPLGASGKMYLDYGFAGLGIPAYSKNKDAAWEFVQYFSAPKQNADFNKKYGPVPTHGVSYKEDPYFSTGAYKAWAVEMTTPDKYVFVKFPWSAPQFPGWTQVQQQYMQAALLGQITAEEAAAKWASYWK
ncbi:MAG TPA: sugar ABC transporter substrate-binding protein [Candidatus Methylomirabilis sp.]|nr:sugar ABC transporter substrate-binding protein [Candidatus Methylomirabilis sp.]